MQNRNVIKIFAIIFAIVCLYQLSFTWVANGVEDDAVAYAADFNEDEREVIGTQLARMICKGNQKRQTNFRNKYNFPFPLLADENKEVINTFGVWGLKKFMGREYDGIHRKTFLIDEKGFVMRVIDKVKTKSHASQILEENE